MGSQLLSYLQLGKETTPGTRVAATRRLAPSLESNWTPDFMQNYHENRSVGRRNPISYASTMGTGLGLNFQTGSEGACWDELQWAFQFPSGATATGSSAPYTWAHGWGGTAAGNYVTFTAEYGDEVQEYEAGYVFATNLGLSAEVGGMTQLSATLVAQGPVKSTKTGSLNVADAPRIPTYLWKMKYASAQSGLSGASYQTGMLKSFNGQWTTGLVAGKYLDGSANFTTAIETAAVAGTFDLLVSHSSAAVTEFYDNAASQTPIFVELTATGPTLGTANYYVDLQLCAIPGNPVPMDSFVDGQSMMRVPLTLAYDDTWGYSMVSAILNNRGTFI